jgi:hypothetical protein
MMVPQIPQPTDEKVALQLFCFETDSFAFANETVWNYVAGKVGSAEEGKDGSKRRYTRRCFVVSRAAVQFWKFARFDPAAALLTEEELARRIRQVARRSVWKPPLPLQQKIVIPGYTNLREASAIHAGTFQQHMGLGWPIYFRVGNFPIIISMNGDDKARVNQEILAALAAGFPTVLWLYNFPALDINHAVVVFAAEHREDRVRYSVYDPNYTDAPKTLEFDASSRCFFFQPTFYFKGGPVTARPVYRSYFE